HQCLYTQYVEDFFYTRFPTMRVKFHNAGVGGAKAWDALQRFDRDVASYKPKYVTVLLGMNDGRYQPFDQATWETYHRDMTELVGRIVDSGATPILMTPTMFDARAARMSDRPRSPESVALYNSVLAYYGNWLRDVAQRDGHGFVDMYSPLNNLTLLERKTNPDFTMIRDAVHPDPPGQIVMAYALIEDIGLRSPLSAIRIVPGPKGELVARPAGGEVSELKRTDDGLEFTWLAEALPFVVPDDALPGAKMLHMGHRMSREAVEIHGLPAGRYELSIDGAVVGTYDSQALARHIELQDNDLTPQYQQAKQVATLNQQRNAGPVRSMRGEWSKFQQFARLEDQAKSAPDNEGLKKQVEEARQRIDGMDQRVAEFEAAAKEIEDQIFAINQPKPRKYVLRRVAGNANAARAKANSIVPANAQLEKLFTRTAPITGGLTEGPAVAPDGSIYFSDIPFGEDRGMILRFDPRTKQTTVFTDDSHKSNGLIFNAAGELWACEGANIGGRAISKWNTKTGQRTVVADSYKGKRFNSPNDLCLDAKGRVYFTDPRYVGDEPRELEHRAVYRIDADGSVHEVTHDISKPNGIAISPDGSTLYVAEHDNGTDKIDPTKPAPPQGEMKIYAFPLDSEGNVSGPRRVHFDFGKQKGCDGMCVDTDGNLYLTGRDPSRPGVVVVNPQGKEIAFIATGPAGQSSDDPDKPPVGLPSNVEFGRGEESNVLYVTVDTSLMRIPLKSRGFRFQDQ
ncbi:MAG: SMP-30/gluconolactonase/LRE family protein, partial [Planctomycetales bacterium]|nr:SMP-30/gluconolactonase/LRE family protein [Planctomycetales bacterium]